MSDKHTAWIKANRITGEATRITKRPDAPASKWDSSASHWIFTLKREGYGPSEPLATFYSQGSAYTKPPPRTVDVLSSLLMDAQSIDGSFEDWCADTGYDTDSRKAERLYDRCRIVGAQLREFLGAAYDSAVETFSDY